MVLALRPPGLQQQVAEVLLKKAPSPLAYPFQSRPVRVWSGGRTLFRLCLRLRPLLTGRG